MVRPKSVFLRVFPEGGVKLRSGRLHYFFFICFGIHFGTGEDFGAWVFLGEILCPLGGRFRLGLRKAEHSAVAKIEDRSDKNQPRDHEADKKISGFLASGHHSLIDILEVSLFCFGESDRQPLFGLFGCFSAMLGNNPQKGGVHILRHPLGVPADIEVGPVF